MENNQNQKKFAEGRNNSNAVKEEARKNRNGNLTPYEYLMRPFLSLLDDSFDEVTSESGLMRTDITEKDNGYDFEIEVPGVDKSQVKVGLDNGYLTVSYKTKAEVKEGEGKKIHVERKTGFYRRDFFVGYNVKKEDIKAKMENGILTIYVPKNVKSEESDKFISIE